ncbi:MAG: IclR family transcriptional regulator [Firmicutes bacterium]|nr:IclR family transcriptional regulator [Bacillota bacterium]
MFILSIDNVKKDVYTSRDDDQSVTTIKMVDQALKVLDTLRMSRKSLGVNEIAKICGIGPSTTFRILKTLEVNGWVFQCSDRRYIAGQKLSFVLEKNNLYLALKEVASFVMERYTAKFQQAMNLTVREGTRCYILQQSRTKNLVDYIPPLYSELPFYACAGGKILLSELPISLVEEILNATEMVPLTPHTITDPERFWTELRTVAKQGYAIDDKESSENGSCIAVPVRDCDGNIIAALSFSGFVGANKNKLTQYVQPLKEASTEISQSLYRCYGR